MNKIISSISAALLVLLALPSSAQYHVSYNGKQLIKKYESCSLTSYWDSNGWTIGYGHHKQDVHKGMHISQTQANVYFNQDIKTVEASVNRLIKGLPYEYKFSQGFIDGLASLIYNCGTTGVKNSTFYARLSHCRVKNGKMNQNDLNYTLAAVKSMNITSPGHVKRRAAEYQIMIN